MSRRVRAPVRGPVQAIQSGSSSGFWLSNLSELSAPANSVCILSATAASSRPSDIHASISTSRRYDRLLDMLKTRKQNLQRCFDIGPRKPLVLVLSSLHLVHCSSAKVLCIARTSEDVQSYLSATPPSSSSSTRTLLLLPRAAPPNYRHRFRRPVREAQEEHLVSASTSASSAAAMRQ